MPAQRHDMPQGPDLLLGRCADIANLRRTVGLLAAVDAPVWIQGETGTGKELVARQLHALSPRASRPFIAVNAATLPDDLAESLLFGHRRGAYSGAYDDHVGFFEAANGGTLFLDEIADLPIATQAKLLRVLDAGTFYRVGETRERRIDVRLITASHRDLTEAVNAGSFREDLLYRINVIPVSLPPLRSRGRDIVILARHFLEQASIRWQRASPTLSPDGERALLRCPWPGNVRELRNVCERAVLLTPSGQPLDHDRVLSFVALGQPTPRQHSRGAQSLGARHPQHGAVGLEEPSEPVFPLDWFEHEHHLLRQALRRAGHNQSRAARLLGLSRDQFVYRLRKHEKAVGGSVGSKARPHGESV